MSALADRIDALLPQTQCKRCGYDDCRAYATAIADNQTDINRCPPGGAGTIRSLAELAGRESKPLDPELGTFQPGSVAFIEEPLCIGCTKCIQACPVDAIVGAAKQMHTVIEALCTGCELCIPPCPVDCIRVIPAQGRSEGAGVPATEPARAEFFRTRYHQRRVRLNAQQRERHARRQENQLGNSAELVAQRKAEIAAAVARVRAKRTQQGNKKT